MQLRLFRDMVASLYLYAKPEEPIFRVTNIAPVIVVETQGCPVQRLRILRKTPVASAPSGRERYGALSTPHHRLIINLALCRIYS